LIEHFAIKYATIKNRILYNHPRARNSPAGHTDYMQFWLPIQVHWLWLYTSIPCVCRI